MAKQPPSKEVTVAGKPLVCPVCAHTRFWSRKALMNTRDASFFNFAWANKSATNQVCEECGYVFWFLK